MHSSSSASTYSFDYNDRLRKVQSALREANHDVLFVTPGADLRYLIGYDALPLERLTCLAIRSSGEVDLIVPELERPAALASGVAELGIGLHAWTETQNPYEVFAKKIGSVTRPLVANLMWAEKAFNLRDAFGAEPHLAGQLLARLRAVKTQDEIEALHEAGAAIDAVHAQVPSFLRVGRTEREVGRDIADAIIQAGHATVDFVIVGSGPNGASPHHELSDRVINSGEPIVIDIGGSMPSGYCSDSTRMYSIGSPDSSYLEKYAILKAAQQAQLDAAGPGMTPQALDEVGRAILRDAGLADFFIHRTGHGIGLETHEDPYIVEGNISPLVPGNAFSIEPGFYIPDTYGARIEDIVTCTPDGISNTNHSSRDFVVVD